MKKNRTMRVMFVLLALTLLTTCAVSGTFAKYVTSAGAEDSARVAKWGVLVSIEGNAFGTEYAAEDEAYKKAGGELSVQASNKEQVVAPGTNSELLDNNLVATITGTPEVAVRYTLKGEGIKDVVLPAGTYTDYTKLVAKKAEAEVSQPVESEAEEIVSESNARRDGEAAEPAVEEPAYGYCGEFTLEKDYAPIKWNLTIEGKGKTVDVVEALYEAIPEGNIAQAEAYGLTKAGCSIFDAITILQKVAGNDGYKEIVETALGNLVSGGRNFQLKADKEAGTFELSYDFDPNKEMDFTFTLSWEWAFEQLDEDNKVIDLYDKADTFLGNWAAVELGQEIEGFVAPEDGSIRIGATVIGTATQID